MVSNTCSFQNFAVIFYYFLKFNHLGGGEAKAIPGPLIKYLGGCCPPCFLRPWFLQLFSYFRDCFPSERNGHAMGLRHPYCHHYKTLSEFWLSTSLSRTSFNISLFFCIFDLKILTCWVHIVIIVWQFELND